MGVSYDAMGPLTAIRMWQVSSEGLLLSIAGTATLWEPGKPMHAEHNWEFGMPMILAVEEEDIETLVMKHQAPVSGCMCGIWCVKEALPNELIIASRDASNRLFVAGEVQIWGKVIEHTDGYRAEHARITKLYVPDHELFTGPSILEFTGIAELYDVPVEEAELRATTTSWGEAVKAAGSVTVTWNWNSSTWITSTWSTTPQPTPPPASKWTQIFTHGGVYPWGAKRRTVKKDE
jgi:hypothetical protein